MDFIAHLCHDALHGEVFAHHSHATSYLTVSSVGEEWSDTHGDVATACAVHPIDASCKPLPRDPADGPAPTENANSYRRAQINVGDLPKGTKQVLVTLEDGAAPDKKPLWLVVGKVNEKWNVSTARGEVSDVPDASTRSAAKAMRFAKKKANEKMEECMQESGAGDDTRKLMQCREECSNNKGLQDKQEEDPNGKHPMSDCMEKCQKTASSEAASRESKCKSVEAQELRAQELKVECEGSTDPQCLVTAQAANEGKLHVEPKHWRDPSCFKECRDHNRDLCSDKCSTVSLEKRDAELASRHKLAEASNARCMDTCKRLCKRTANAKQAADCDIRTKACRTGCDVLNAKLQADINNTPPSTTDGKCYSGCMKEVQFPGLGFLPEVCRRDCEDKGWTMLGENGTFSGLVNTKDSHPSSYRELEIPYKAGHDSDSWIHPRHFKAYALACDADDPFPLAYAARQKEPNLLEPSVNMWQALKQDIRNCMLAREDHTALGVAQKL